MEMDKQVMLYTLFTIISERPTEKELTYAQAQALGVIYSISPADQAAIKLAMLLSK